MVETVNFFCYTRLANKAKRDNERIITLEFLFGSLCLKLFYFPPFLFSFCFVLFACVRALYLFFFVGGCGGN